MDTLPNIFLTRELPAETMVYLSESCSLTFNKENRALSRDELIDGIRDKDGLICLLTDTIDAVVMDAAPSLKVISNYAVGYNNIDVAAATQRGIAVTNTPGVLTDATADLAWALLLACARKVVAGDRFVRSGEWTGWGPLQYLGTEVSGATLGIVGLGRIGMSMIPRASAFRMRVAYWNRTRLPIAEEHELGISYMTLEQLLNVSDFVSLHVALTPDTFHLIGEEQLAAMKPTAYLINTSRGPVVDERALVRALAAGQIAGAGLDVYENEPALEPELSDLRNVVLLPHLGSATVETRTQMGMMAARGCLAACAGARPANIVNPDVYRDEEIPQ